ncbi:MAG: hypothetical protein E7473_11010 [Ruminococcaceae bacterium]|nr:hypothetical protein [Oscillospiraceae bacterium]
MKRIVALILIMCISSLFIVLPTSAEGEVYVSAGNTVLPLTGALPIRSSGVWYIDYQCFTKGGLGVSASYNPAEGLLVLYTWDMTLIFDLKMTVAYKAADRVQYKAVSFISNGTVYVPVQFTAQMLDLDYTYFSDLPMIRIKKSGDIQDNMFMYIAENEIAQQKKASSSQSSAPSAQSKPTSSSTETQSQTQASEPTANQENSNESTLSPSADSEKPSTSTLETGQSENVSANESRPDPADDKDNKKPEEIPEIKHIKLTFNITDSAQMAKILDALSVHGYRATFFICGKEIENCENEIRKAIVSGHSIGTLSYNGSADFSLSDEEIKNSLAESNRKLFEISKTKTRLLRVPDRSSSLQEGRANTLISLGYRIWDSDFTPTGKSASAMYNSTVTKLKKLEQNVVIEFSDSDIHIDALTRLLQYFKSNKYLLSSVDLLDIPVNDIGDKR